MTRVRITALTHRGLVRDHNEDCVGWSGWAFNGEVTQPVSMEMEIAAPSVVVVCDGMGGHAAGETASRLAATLITAPGALGPATTQSVTALLQQVSDTINDVAVKDPALTGMGCTVVGAVLYPGGTALVFNVGDSRCYRVEGQYLAQLSVDHRDATSNGLTQALGGGGRIFLEPDFFECRLPSEPGLLLCSDGLDDYADPLEIEKQVLSAGSTLEMDLRDLALRGGGGDNVTIVSVNTAEERAVG
ncbi:PP2C family serine/threonine-protein phosphatase [Mycobacterium sp. GA-1841]|uniref:PP2C family protein-serine/threonine phosphatase n=1 Tax=Mycobacterium sp. GA-1841 TaxID=1834154 RepID=UPI0011157FC2|nr:protein phosphatase 2C domain-containing protein [Mycobacterium sp. GA-1841]